MFHDDQHGTAIVALAALTNALKVVGKELPDVRIVLSGAGAAGTAVLKLLLAAGAHDVVVADIEGVVHPGRPGLSPSLAWTAVNTNPRRVTGTLREAVVDADVFIGVSAPTSSPATTSRAWRRTPSCSRWRTRGPRSTRSRQPSMPPSSAPGSDFANQINNVLAFPGVFRGLLDARSHRSPTRCCSPPPARSRPRSTRTSSTRPTSSRACSTPR